MVFGQPEWDRFWFYMSITLQKIAQNENKNGRSGNSL